MNISSYNRLFDRDWLGSHIRKMYRMERKQTFPEWQRSAQYAFDLLKSEGFQAEKIDFPADGRTVYQDKCTPIGWNCSHMTCRLLTRVAGITDPVISDFSREPLEAVKGSVSTPVNGIDTFIVTESQMKAGTDVTGAFVLLDSATRPRGEAMRMLLDLGAIGWISDYVENPLRDPDGVAWINAGCEYNSWHVQAGDRPFISYQISPRNGFYLRSAVNKGTVMVHAESDACRYESFLPVVTGILPGQDKREIWLNAHLYEPLIDDNSNGVIGCIALMKAIRKLADEGKITLKYSIRCVFASEMYGFSAYADRFVDLHDSTLGAMVMDGLMNSTDKSWKSEYTLYDAADFRFPEDRSGGFAGNIIMDELADDISAEFPDMIVHHNDHIMGDDNFLSDASIGLPSVWIRHGSQGFHHNSMQDESHIDIDAYVRNLSFCFYWLLRMTASSEREIRELLPRAFNRAVQRLENSSKDPVRQDTDYSDRIRFLREQEAERIRALSLWADIPEIAETAAAIPTPKLSPFTLHNTCADVRRPAYARSPVRTWFDYAGDFYFTRIERGFPHDLIRVQPEMRKAMPGTILYSDLSDVVSRMTPGVSFRDILREVEWDRGIVFTEDTVKEYLFTCTFLADSGYLSLSLKNATDGDSLAKALKDLGVRDGSTILVHSSLSGLGYIPGGTDTVMNALRSAVGKSGTFLAPAFSEPYIAFEGEINRSYLYRPYDTRPDGALRDKSIWTGALPKAMLKDPLSFRSGHVSHEWVAIGANAETAVSGHGFLDAPAGASSPMHYALDHDGDVIFLGCDITSNTFIHYCETEADIPCLGCGIVKYIDTEGKTHTALIEKHLPGDRDFYHDPAVSEFYRKAVERGLHIYSVRYGMGNLYRMNLRELYEITNAMLAEDPNSTLCDDPACPFCSKFRKL